MMIEVIVGIVSIIVTAISIRQNTKKEEHQKSNRSCSPKQSVAFWIFNH